MTIQVFDIHVPLQNFHWTGDSFELAPGLWIRKHAERPDLMGWDGHLSEDERNLLFAATHWLTFQWRDGSEPSPASISNLVLLAFWLVKPSRMQVAFRFKLGPLPTTDGAGRSRLHDRFQWIPGVPTEDFQDSDLQTAARNYTALSDMYCAGGRLNDALLLTVAGCWSHQWQVALACYSAASETLLTYSTDRGITKRLAEAYACLVETQSNARDREFTEFKTLYSIRSDIMHGRTHNVSAAARLPYLARFAEVLRKIWRVVVTTPPLIRALQGTDADRKVYFDAIRAGYVPPP